jgi:parvulin-like peptidyl-prolyl isomerase
MRRTNLILIICAFCLPARLQAGQETSPVIDRVLAVVDEEVITLTDVRIAEAFQIFTMDEEDSDPPLVQILNRFIDQKIILQMASEQLTVSDRELDESVSQITGRFTPAQMTDLFGRFGLTWSGLSGYIRESLLFEKAIYNKFSRSVFVSLKEIETYYGRIYVPERRQAGREIRPMLDILDEIETAIRREKIRNQVHDWLRTLRRQANIQIKETGILRNKIDGSEDPAGFASIR